MSRPTTLRERALLGLAELLRVLAHVARFPSDVLLAASHLLHFSVWRPHLESPPQPIVRRFAGSPEARQAWVAGLSHPEHPLKDDDEPSP